ncbi:MAG TPA: hypothetical protein VGA56_05895 [Opitutaceae bacterium]
MFGDHGAKAAFLRCLGQLCEKTGRVIHAWCAISNHCHLALRTPEANLIGGKLAATFLAIFLIPVTCYVVESLAARRRQDN